MVLTKVLFWYNILNRRPGHLLPDAFLQAAFFVFFDDTSDGASFFCAALPQTATPVKLIK